MINTLKVLLQGTGGLPYGNPAQVMMSGPGGNFPLTPIGGGVYQAVNLNVPLGQYAISVNGRQLHQVNVADTADGVSGWNCPLPADMLQPAGPAPLPQNPVPFQGQPRPVVSTEFKKRTGCTVRKGGAPFGTIVVTVKSAMTSAKPVLPGATADLRLEAGDTLRGVADPQGRIVFNNVPPGSHTIVVDNGWLWRASEAKVGPGDAVDAELTEFIWVAKNWKWMAGGLLLLVGSAIFAVLFGSQVSSGLLVAGAAVAIGGRTGYILLNWLTNGVDSIYQGERGWMEDVWGPIAAGIVILVTINLLQNDSPLEQWFMTIAPTDPQKMLGLWTPIVWAFGFIGGAAFYAILRAMTVLRLKKRFSFVPLIATLGPVVAVHLYPYGTIGKLPVVAIWVVGLIYAATWVIEFFRKPLEFGLGSLLGVVMYFIPVIGMSFGYTKDECLLVTTIIFFGVAAYLLVSGFSQARSYADTNDETANNIFQFTRVVILFVAVNTTFWLSAVLPLLGK